MCQAKIVDHYNNKYKCLRPNVVTYSIEITYGNGHMKGKTKKYIRTLCKKHSKIFRYNLNRKRDKGHKISIKEL